MRKGPAVTRLERFLRAWEISPTHLAAHIDMTFDNLRLLRYGKRKRGAMEDAIRKITEAVRVFTGEDVKASHLFELGDDTLPYPDPAVPPSKRRVDRR